MSKSSFMEFAHEYEQFKSTTERQIAEMQAQIQVLLSLNPTPKFTPVDNSKQLSLEEYVNENDKQVNESPLRYPPLPSPRQSTPTGLYWGADVHAPLLPTTRTPTIPTLTIPTLHPVNEVKQVEEVKEVQVEEVEEVEQVEKVEKVEEVKEVEEVEKVEEVEEVKEVQVEEVEEVEQVEKVEEVKEVEKVEEVKEVEKVEVKKKRKPNGYIVFSKEMREATKAKLAEDNGEKPQSKEVMKELAAMWKDLSEHDRRIWTDKAKA